MKISLYLALGFCVVAFLIGTALGYSFTSEYRLSMYDSATMDLGSADRAFDLRYLNAMIAHHRGAMLLATQLQQNTLRPELKQLAENILRDEPAAIEELYSWKQAWYGDTKRVTDPVVANLGQSDDTFDLRFLNALIAHHEAGIHMTKEVRTKSSRSEVLNNADAVEAFLTGGITALKQLRSDWYGV